LKRMLAGKTVWIIAGLLLAPLSLYPSGLTFVIDILQETHSAAQLIDDTRMIGEAIQTYNQIVQTYNQIAYNAMYLSSKNAWLGMASVQVMSQTGNVFGETGPWNEAVNGGVNIPGAYATATYQMTPAPVYSAYPVGNSLMSANIASVNVADGSNPAAMAVIAQARQTQPLNDIALTQLEQTTQDGSLNTKSEVEQLNLANGGIVLLNRQVENLAAVNTTLAEQQILANKVKRDELAGSINFYSTLDETVQAGPTAWGNSAQTIANW
jgi:hypothetical protein